MPQQIINETSMVVEREIDQFLEEFCYSHPFTLALSIPYFRLKLKANVLSKIPNRHQIKTEEIRGFAADHPLPSILDEKSAIEKEIRRVMPEMISSRKNKRFSFQTVKTLKARESQTIFADNGNGNSAQKSEDSWWVRIHTIIPCATYYFGPFATQGEAKDFAPGYGKDLKAEKAVGITTTIQQGEPDQLTIIDSPEELIQDQKILWENYKKLYRKKSLTPSSSQRALDDFPGNYLVISLDGKIEDANLNACRLLNLSIEILRGDPVMYYVPQQQILTFANHLETILKDDSEWVTPYRWSMQLQALAIATINVDIQVSQKRDAQGEIIAYYWLLNDVTALSPINNQLYYDSFARDRLTRTT